MNDFRANVSLFGFLKPSFLTFIRRKAKTYMHTYMLMRMRKHIKIKALNSYKGYAYNNILLQTSVFGGITLFNMNE